MQTIQDKQLISDIISYLTSQNIIGITYAEAIDMDTIAQLNVYITNTLPNGNQDIPAKRISLLDGDPSTIQLLRQILNFLSQENSVGFDYHFCIPDSPMELDLHVQLEEIKKPN